MPTAHAQLDDYRAAGATILCQDPLIACFDDFISDAEAAAVRAQAEGRMIRATVIDSNADTGDDRRKSSVRTNRVFWVKHGVCPEVAAVSQRVADLVKMPLPHAESMQIIHYSTNTEYKEHFDAFDPASPAGAKHWRRGGQRLITALCYLNTPRRGGHTNFPQLDLDVPAISRRLVIFHNCRPGTLERHPLSKHAGTPVLGGHKWAFNLWFRDQVFETPVEPPKIEKPATITPAPSTLLKQGLAQAKTRQAPLVKPKKKHPLLSE